MKYQNLSDFIDHVRARDPHQPEFLQAVQEVMGSLWGFIGAHPRYADAGLLERLVEKGFVKEVQEEATAEYQLPRTRHIITGAGRQAVNEYCDIMGMQLVGANLA